MITDHSAIRILFRAPDTLVLYGIPYGMRKDIGQEPRHLWEAARKRYEGMGNPARYRGAGPFGPFVPPDPLADWVVVDERRADVLAWLSALVDVPQGPCEWCECRLATDAELSTERCHDGLATISHEPGDIVRVLPGYRQPMGAEPARFVPDGTEGVYLVKSPLRDKCDYRLIRFGNELLLSQLTPEQRKHCATTMDWDLICSPSRLVRHFWQTAR